MVHNIAQNCYMSGSMTASPKSDIDVWAMLRQELDQWLESGKTATFWWRDDDAIEETEQLHRLDALSRETGVSVALAVIPAGLLDTLSLFLHPRDNFSVMQHGYSHSSYAAKGIKKIELGGERTIDEIHTELRQGYHQLDRVFEKQFIPVLVPPWNRIEPRIFPALVKAGFKGLSTMWARESAYPLNGLLQVNTHLDPVKWRHDRGFIGETAAIDQIHQHINARRLARTDFTEPSGILTHHLSQNDEVWEFCEKLFEFLNRHPAAQWLDARKIWGVKSGYYP